MSDKLFLDANILFSAAYKEKAGLLQLWSNKNNGLFSSLYAIEEAYKNLKDEAAQQRLDSLLKPVNVIKFGYSEILLPDELVLREKDRPILKAAIHCCADYLITGDFRDFGRYFEQNIQGVIILPPVVYLKKSRENFK